MYAGHTVGLTSKGTVVAVGDNYDGQCDVSGWKDIVAISAGSDHSVGLKSDGTVVFVGSTAGYKHEISHWTDIQIPTDYSIPAYSGSSSAHESESYIYDEEPPAQLPDYGPAIPKSEPAVPDVEYPAVVYSLDRTYDALDVYTPIAYSEASASSELTSSGGYTYPAEYAGDYDNTTCWQEGVPSYGVGESLTLYFPQQTSVSAISILPGNGNSQEAFDRNGKRPDWESLCQAVNVNEFLYR